MKQHDAWLVDLWVTRGDEEAFEQIVARYEGLVYRTCKRILGNETEAEDLTQECFLQLANALPRVHTSLGGWLYTQASRNALRRIRTEGRRRRREEAYAACTYSLEETAGDDIQRFIDEAIVALPERFRGPIVLHYFEERTHEAIGRELGITRSAVTHRINRGIAEVRKTLERRNVSITGFALAALLHTLHSDGAVPRLVSGGNTSPLLRAAVLQRRREGTPRQGVWANTFVRTMTRMGLAGLLIGPLVYFGGTYVSLGSRFAGPIKASVRAQSERHGPAANSADRLPEASQSHSVGTEESLSEDVNESTRRLAGVLRGRVIDITGEPVEGAKINVCRNEYGVKGSSQAGANGAFAVDVFVIDEDAPRALEAPHALVGVTAQHEDYQWPTGLWEVPLRGHDVELVLAQGEIRGQVVDASTGVPVNTFELRVTREVDLYGPMTADYPWSRFESPDGQFSLPVRCETTAIEVRGKGFAERVLREREIHVGKGEILDGLIIGLVPGVDVAGLVVDARTGLPVEGARVGLGLTKTLARRGIRASDFDAITGPDGRFLIAGQAAPGNVGLRIAHPEYAPEYVIDFDTTSVEEPVVPLSRGGIARVTIFDELRPVPNLFIALELMVQLGAESYKGSPPYADGSRNSFNDSSQDLYQADGFSSADGTYEIAGLPPGEYRVTVARTGIEGNVPRYEVLASTWMGVDNGVASELELDLADLSIVRGNILPASDLDQIVLALYDARHPDAALYTSTGSQTEIGLSASGEFRFPLVPAGNYIVRGRRWTPDEEPVEVGHICSVARREILGVPLEL